MARSNYTVNLGLPAKPQGDWNYFRRHSCSFSKGPTYEIRHGCDRPKHIRVQRDLSPTG